MYMLLVINIYIYNILLVRLDADRLADRVDGDGQILSPDDTTLLHAFRQRFIHLGGEPCSDDVWTRFFALVDEMTAEAAVIVKLPVRSVGRASGNSTQIDPTDAKWIQSLYRRNIWNAMRLILSGEGRARAMLRSRTLRTTFGASGSRPPATRTSFRGWRAVTLYRLACSSVPLCRNVSQSSRTLRLVTTGSRTSTGKAGSRVHGPNGGN